MAILLMTRPQDAAQRFVAMLPVTLTSKLRVVYSPLISIRVLDDEINLKDGEAVIFTSSSGVLAASGIPDHAKSKAYCLGSRTREIAEDAGWNAETIGKNADDMVANLLQHRPSAPLVHLRGQHARGRISKRLTEAGLTCRESVVYDQNLLDLTAEAHSVLAMPHEVIVPLFSPRTARQFADLCPKGAKLHLIAMSDAVEKPLECLKYSSLWVSREPEAQSVAELVQDVAARLIRVEGDKTAQ